MKSLASTPFRLVLTLFAVGLISTPSANAQTSATQSARKPVVVELFTSEGCSSCPPADLLLQRLQKEQPVAGAEIIALEEHVDYWNHDGWIDPYSSPEWTERQEAYVSLSKNDAYTPEVVVDGSSQFVGNNPHEAVVEIEKAARGARTEVAVTSGKPEAEGSRHFTVSVGKLVGNRAGDVAEVWLAVTEDGLHSAVSLGENAGHVLNHTATLRSLHKIGVADAGGTSVSFTGDPLVKFNSHWDLKNVHVVAFVQEKKSREILGAASTGI
ncbi:MAG: DUF1223 domain-containing protein [Candidatus Sulfotelmatobacter sp.]|jgi:hypothetical protein